MPSLTTLLVFLAVLGVSNGLSYIYGQHVEAAEQAQAREKAVTAAIEDHNKNSLIDMEAAYEDGLAKGRYRTAAGQNRQAFNAALSVSPRRPDVCDMPRAAYDRLLDAVQLANADTPAAERLSPAMLRPPKASQPAR